MGPAREGGTEALAAAAPAPGSGGGGPQKVSDPQAPKGIAVEGIGATGDSSGERSAQLRGGAQYLLPA